MSAARRFRVAKEKLRKHDDEVVGSEMKADNVTLKVPKLDGCRWSRQLSNGVASRALRPEGEGILSQHLHMVALVPAESFVQDGPPVHRPQAPD
jgi:hypothetical protein